MFVPALASLIACRMLTMSVAATPVGAATTMVDSLLVSAAADDELKRVAVGGGAVTAPLTGAAPALPLAMSDAPPATPTPARPSIRRRLINCEVAAVPRSALSSCSSSSDWACIS